MAVTETETTNQTPSDAGVRKPVLSESRARRIYLIIGGVVVVFLIGFLIYKFVMAGKESTDDAQVSADVVPVAARIPGQISAVYVQENQLVHRGDVIADIDPRDAAVRVAQAQGDFETAQAQAASADARLQIARAMATGGLQMAQAGVRASRDQADTLASAVNAARAAVTRAEANAQKASNDWKRAQELGGKGDISRSQLDAARAAHESAQADVASARAQLQSAINNQQTGQANIQQAQGRLTQNAPVGAEVQAAQADAKLAHAHVATAQAILDAARLTMSYTKIIAPADGIASKLAVHAGALVAQGQPIVQLVPMRTYVIANFKETQVARMKPGQRATIRVDALGSHDFEGKIESLSGGTGASFSLLPPDNASGNFVKVVQRVPVRISWNGPTSDRAAVGASADVTVYTK
jgi:membrane fusion protein (multidrug efflux system)